MYLKAGFLLLITIMVVSFGCKENTSPDSNYPSTVNTLSSKSIDNLYLSIANTPVYGCSLLDEFGFFVYNTNDDELCSIEDSVQSAFSMAELETMAKKAALRYSSITGVTDTASMSVKNITTKDPNSKTNTISYSEFITAYPDSFPDSWTILFDIQKIDGIEVRGTIMKMLINTVDVVAIDGNWFSDVYIPEIDYVDLDAAKKSLIGEKLTYSTYTITPNDDTYWYSTDKIILPITRSNKIEMRVGWALCTSNWEIVVDSQTGETLSIVRF